MALQPEETMSKKKNRHEVTDLIIKEKSILRAGRWGTQLEGRGRWEKAQDTEVEVCCFAEGNQKLKRVLPFLAAPPRLYCSKRGTRAREGPGPSPAARQ